MNNVVNKAEKKELVPLDLTPLPLEQDDGKRRSMYALVQRWRGAFEGWHGPLRIPDRDRFLAVSTEDFVLTSNGSTYICGVDAYIEVARVVLAGQINVTMSMVILEVAEHTAWIHDVHAWWLPDGYRFESGRFGRLYRRKGEDRICRWEILQTNPAAAQEFFDSRYQFGRR